jgi:hypothetical protein
VSPMRYELSFYIPGNHIFHSYRRENLKSYEVLPAFISTSSWAYSSALKMEAIYCYESSVDSERPTQRCAPEGNVSVINGVRTTVRTYLEVNHRPNHSCREVSYSLLPVDFSNIVCSLYRSSGG